MKSFAIVTLLIAAAPSWAAEIYNFSLLPANGQIQGTPGTAIGWGYMLENQSSDYWLVPTGLSNNSFEFGTPLNVFDFPILAPSTSAAEPFNLAAALGLFQLMWDSASPHGFSNTGTFTLEAEWWSDDPFAGGVLVSGAPMAYADYSAAVAPVPEPGSLGLTTVAALAALLLTARGVRCSRSREAY